MTAPGGHNSAITWNPHVRVAWGGQLGTSGEIWTNSMKWLYAADNTVPSVGDLDAMMTTVIEHLSAWFISPSSGISAAAHLSWIKANYVLATGLQTEGDTQQRDFPVVNGVVTAIVPFYQTFALTFRTAKSRGRAHSGRIFPPVVSYTMGADGYCAAGIAEGAATAFATFLSQSNADISAAGPNPGAFAVLSPGNSTKGTAPTSQLITGVVMDRVPDVQHRRTNRLVRSEGALAPVTG